MRTKMIYILLWWPSWYLLFFMHGTEGELQWVVAEKISSYGQSLTLFCSVDNCCNEPAGWSKGSTPTTIILDFKTYSDDPNLKYGSTHNKSGFGLVIRNFSETDLNKTYECAYGFQISTHQYLLQEDVFRKDGPSTDKENRTTDDPSTDEENSTDEGDNTIIIVAIIVSALLIALIIILIIFCLYRRQQHFSGTKQSDINNSVNYGDEQQQELLSPTSECNAPTWCICTHCREMPTKAEKVCCDQAPWNCYSRHQKFDRILDVVDQKYGQAAEHDDNTERRREAYKQCSKWIEGLLGYGNRKPIPSCCVWKIRDTYPDIFGRYHGFEAKT